jgi:transcriptional regulator with GAF, ATPase, and Fis domain
MAGQVTEFLGMPVVFSSPLMLRALEVAQRVAQTDAGVLVLGESGTGKEVLARAVHHYSPRSAKPWVDISCAALPEHLMESELFGHEKGAFSGADSRKPGLFELADTGTLFLDEIGELDMALQAKLLRVLDSGEFFRLGSTRKVKVDVRIVAATNKDLLREVEARRFRADLYYRIAQVKMEVPPLRSRPEDILPIARLFLEKHRPQARFSSEVAQALTGYSWPGNVRQLRNAVMCAVAMSVDDEIDLGSLPSELAGLALLPDFQNGAPAAGSNGEPSRDLDSLEQDSILRALTETKGHQENAARILGISPRTLHRKLKQYRQKGELGAACQASRFPNAFTR